MGSISVAYGIWVVFFLVLTVWKEGFRVCGDLPTIVLIHVARLLGLYNAIITEILLCSIVLLFNEVPKILIPYMLDRLTYIMLDLIFALTKSTTLKPGDVKVGIVMLLALVLAAKMFFVIVVRHDSKFVSLLLYAVFYGDMLNKLSDFL